VSLQERSDLVRVRRQRFAFLTSRYDTCSLGVLFLAPKVRGSGSGSGSGTTLSTSGLSVTGIDESSESVVASSSSRRALARMNNAMSKVGLPW
jgi:hypothetical protein